eukprot:Blabericola_migrator_1__13577@NODE_999_length_5741_cov_116_595523_g56_i2_p2_GENE_NODE_999_length_5741_cov_116_595523_g56_i2NODE_999_length_5741_cov_116_595523_g56_i2_p2_ORF_typecomplete_len479_score99_82vATPsynt_AC39/PF01992_16/2_1e96_NODE_999_length_5741_cov_116_595523_g56_i25441980
MLDDESRCSSLIWWSDSSCVYTAQLHSDKDGKQDHTKLHQYHSFSVSFVIFVAWNLGQQPTKKVLFIPPANLSLMGAELSLFNVQDGFSEALIRGFRGALLTPDDYRKLGMAESLEDLRSALEDTDYGSFLQDESSPLAVTIFGTQLRQKMASEFRYIQSNANYPLNKFLDFIVAERMIDNVISLIQGSLNKKNPEELLARADPLGWSPEMKTLLTLDASSGYDELYRTVLIDTPVGRYFENYLDQQDTKDNTAGGARTVNEVSEAFSELDLEVMRASLKKAWLEDFYAFCQELGGTTAEVMGDILKKQADFLVISVTLNSLNAPMGGANQLSDRNSLYPSFGYLYPAGTDAMRKAFNDSTIRAALDCYPQYLELYEQCREFYIRENEGAAGAMERDPVATRNVGHAEEQVSLEDAVYKQEVKMYEFAYEQQMHYGVFYAWMKLKEQEIRNILWIADMILMQRKDQLSQVLPIFGPRY